MKVDFAYTAKHYANKTFDQMKDVLMDPSAPAPSVFYHMIRGSDGSGNVTVLEPGTVGEEYIKTVGHYHMGNLNETYFIKNGQGVALLQKLAKDSEGNYLMDVVEEFKAITFKEGDQIYMPGDGWGHVIINTGEKYLVTIDDTVVYFDETKKPQNGDYAEYEMVAKMHGFAFYVIDNGGTPALKKNLNYKEVRKHNFDTSLLLS
jgi:oxalate decarboxylase/phosphoglucose isomerase-like protein (cupin superfamily)